MNNKSEEKNNFKSTSSFYLRKKEGTEIFDYGNAIDERTAKKAISAEEADKENAIPDTVVGFIGENESQKFAL